MRSVIFLYIQLKLLGRSDKKYIIARLRKKTVLTSDVLTKFRAFINGTETNERGYESSLNS